MSLDELKLHLSIAIDVYLDGLQVSDPDKCKEIARETMLLAALAHVAHNGSDEAFMRMAQSALEGAQMASPKQ
jgi:hypothetical protein